MKNDLGEYTLNDLSEELRRRGWRIVPVNVLAMLAGGIATGFWASVKEESDGE